MVVREDFSNGQVAVKCYENVSKNILTVEPSKQAYLFLQR